jgi:hypothetical protein
MLLFEIVVGHPPPEPMAAFGEVTLPPGVPEFVREMIDGEQWQWRRSKNGPSLTGMIETLKTNEFQIVGGVEAAEVAAFVRWIESGEESGEWE